MAVDFLRSKNARKVHYITFENLEHTVRGEVVVEYCISAETLKGTLKSSSGPQEFRNVINLMSLIFRLQIYIMINDFFSNGG